MCGICGIASTRLIKGRHPERAMLAKLKHRGPDGEGRWQDDHVVLAMRRLSIIDLAGGQQPLYNEDKSLVIVGNGEIYNYIELKKLILHRGHKPRTGSDIEIILHLFEDEGIECLKRLRGMFALAIYDIKRQVFYLIRDRIGEKPIYWTEVDQQLVFSSEIKSLLAFKSVNRELDFQAIDDFFHYYYVLEPRTAFANIYKLLPAHYLKFDLRNGEKKTARYWHPEKITMTSRVDPTEMIRNKFTEACKLTLRADVPVGISLSGGLDSSAILAVSSKIYKDKLRAFSVGYEGRPKNDERSQARWLADKLGVEFKEIEVPVGEVVDELPSLVSDSDGLVSDIASHSIRSVSRLAHSHGMKVLVGGLGGDELFWGYDWMRQVTLENILKGTTRFYERSLPFRTGENFLRRLYTHNFKSIVTPTRFRSGRAIRGKYNLAKFGLDSIRDGWLVSNCLVLADRLSMSSSIELRSPFLDHRLIEAILKNSHTVLGYHHPGKYWFKKAMATYLPEEVLNRPKRGFNPPVGRWLFGILSKYLPLLDGGFTVQEGIISSKAVRIIINSWWLAPMLWYPLYQLVVLEIWGREFYYGVEPMDIR